MNNTKDIRQLSKIYDITDPWIQVNPERESWLVTLDSGKQVNLWLPLGAAVELEERGYRIVAGC